MASEVLEMGSLTEDFPFSTGIRRNSTASWQQAHGPGRRLAMAQTSHQYKTSSFLPFFHSKIRKTCTNGVREYLRTTNSKGIFRKRASSRNA